jgi:hypothetical protein
MVPGITRDIEVKLANTVPEWEAAFRLVRENYLDSGYDNPSQKLFRFTPYHALPDTTVFVAKCDGQVVATFTLVPDARPLGLPLESLYQEEVDTLRQEKRRIAEVTSLAVDDLTQREFVQVFTTMIRMIIQYHLFHGGDTWVITVNPRHRAFYCKTIGFVSLGPCRSYEAVKGHPAEAYWTDLNLIRTRAPKMFEAAFAESFAPEMLAAARMPVDLVRRLAAHTSSQFNVLDVEQILSYVERNRNPRCW